VAQHDSRLPAVEASQVCNQVARIKAIPFRTNENGVDSNYDALRKQAVPIEALCACISDERQMQDPRMSPTRVDNFKVGDAAYMLVVIRLEMQFGELTDASATSEIAKNGPVAYFEWVNRDSNRATLANHCSLVEVSRADH
jgi:hypothetical protein